MTAIFFPQELVEKGMRETKSGDAFEKNRSTNEADEKVEKPSDVAENTSLLVIYFILVKTINNEES